MRREKRERENGKERKRNEKKGKGKENRKRKGKGKETINEKSRAYHKKICSPTTPIIRLLRKGEKRKGVNYVGRGRVSLHSHREVAAQRMH